MALRDFITTQAAALQALLADPTQRLALAAATVAALLILVSAFVKTIIPLRWLAVGSNLGFMLYGWVHPAWLIFALHATLLPVNVWRVLEMHRLTRRVRRATDNAARSDVWLQPHMRRKRMRAGAVLFRKGDLADRLYVLAEGRIELVESGRFLEPGRMFGEIAFFAPDRQRSATARCATACTVLSLDETTFRQLYFQNPDFGFEVVRLIAGRLTEDIQRLQEQLAERSRGGQAP
ncbi:MAG: cyclic nucleotide-binding domain-containing protein [Chitinophagaceae bacterium]|nr:cyclic nucleotide-binding domain-containing protein [Rubrivivax sp.]